MRAGLPVPRAGRHEEKRIAGSLLSVVSDTEGRCLLESQSTEDGGMRLCAMAEGVTWLLWAGCQLRA